MASGSAVEEASKQKVTAPYGSWKSPITAEAVSSAGKRSGGIAVDGTGRLCWLEPRPYENGRDVIVKEPEELGGKPIDVSPEGVSVRSLAQEYGGGDFTVSGNMVIFSNYEDQRLYKKFIGDSVPLPLTPDYGGPIVRYADGVLESHSNHYITVREDHRESSQNPTTTIVSIDLRDGNVREPRILVSGNDFYAFPRLDSNGKRLAWVEWSHPNMHWDKAELWVGYISENGEVYKRVCVAGGDDTVIESPTEPKWSSKGELLFVTDRKSGFWNLYKWTEGINEVQALYTLDAEFTQPFWNFGFSSYDFLQNNGKSTNYIACTYRQNGRSYLGILDDVESSFSLLDIPFTDINNIVSAPHSLYIEGASPVLPLSIAKVTLNESHSKVIGFSIIWSSSPDCGKYKSYFSVPEIIEFPTEVGGQKAYAYFYSPFSHTYQASLEERPPLLLRSHGGPTAEARETLDLSIQYWTSRGWAFADVNYGGSTGYGREYRERLLGLWGVVDVNDCCSCARYLVDSGKVDEDRLCITGESAGGYTTLASLAFRETFKGGSSLYGIADLSTLKAEMHKFESCYIDNLVGNERSFFERSPINFVDKFSCPVILFQGLDDKVVLPTQARKIHLALKKKGLPVALVEFEGEQHGFRKAENLKFTLEQQMLFFARMVGHFEVADEISPIRIDNVD
ncbi:Peptidase S9 [Cinnamomum micranthum f. kanehirae]|uniref:Peptidase S9 n=1 Tax=Cinnamomum micranthum f. kanehirae TaxID=337451 RepID=A0A3S3N224_9MAGN|nr:Peptidase S9 [Cinnamomum micranthum f. kanehirae]